MTLLSIVIGIWFAYWWHFVRETKSEREYREKQQQKNAEWKKHNMDRFK